MPHLIKVLIVEDQELFRLKLEAFILELGYELVASTDNSEEAIKLILDKKPDVVIMDININGQLNGLEVAQKLQYLNTSFLFITCLKEKELYHKAKQTSFIGFLIKPFDEITLQSAIEFALNKLYNEKLWQQNLKQMKSDLIVDDSVLIKHNAQLYKVFISDVLYIEAKGKLSIVHTTEKNLISNASLKNFIERFSQKEFLRIHKSYIINTKHLNRVILKDNEIYINGNSLPIGRAYKSALLQRFPIF